ncbi:hypothetical protein GCM10010912_31440 [Paenibacillus albidus]|uniref:SLH domain-containing protein n=1 Tax=Paenibacillus albidus TaxID=2041023 RepID=A0A917CC72_9BACL|nr:DUF4430 domain-containing protein [Paenibacillus albidus]GGF83952.1 hypothetical protein GCM10010912_31440 [Paenibacillus albidus]
MKKLLTSKACALGLALLLVISVLGTALVPAGQVRAQAQNSAVQEETSVTEATYDAGAAPVDAKVATQAASVTDAIYKAKQYVLANGSLSEWNAMSIARSGTAVPDSYRTGLESTLKAANGTFTKVTDYARISLAVTAIGRDATNFGGYNLIEKIYNFGQMTKQGVNGPIYSLLALDSGQYKVPDDALWTQAKLLKEILSKQNADGGFIFFGTQSDPDITAMTLNALSLHKDDPDVQAAGTRAVNWLSQAQKADGGYNHSSESTSQAIIGLTSMGIDPAGPEFTKAGGNLVDHLLSFALPDGSFRHLVGSGANGMATEQALQALVAYDLYLKGETFYHFTQPGSQKPGVQAVVSIEGPQAPIAAGTIHAATAVQGLEKLAQAKNISLEIKDSSMGKYVKMIDGVSEALYGGYDGWMFAVSKDGHWKQPDVGAGDYLLQPSEKVLFYYGEYGVTNFIQSVSVTPEHPEAGKKFFVTVLKEVSDWDGSKVVTHTVPAADVQVSVAGQTVTADAEGVATFPAGVAGGTHTLEITGYQKDAVPSVVRHTSKLAVSPKQASISIEGPQGLIGQGVGLGYTALDALEQLADSQGIPLEITNSSGMGKYVTSIGEVKEKLYGPYDGWMFAVYKDGRWTQPDVGAADYKLAEADQLLFYYGDFSETQLVNSVIVTPAVPESGQAFSVKVTKDVTQWTDATGTTVSTVPAAEVQVSIGDDRVTTNAEGIASFTSGKAAGTHTLLVTGYREGAVPTLVRTATPLIIKAASTTAPVASTATISVVGDSSRGTILSSRTMTLNGGDTPYSLLVRQLGGQVIAEGSGSNLYVSSIAGLSEFDLGPLSGWMYSVNGIFPKVSAGAYTLSSGDVVAWRYTTNGGVDLNQPTDGSGTTGGAGGAGGGTAGAITSDNTLSVNQVGQTTTVTNEANKMTAAEAAAISKTLAANKVSITQEVTPGAAAALKDNANEVQLQVPAGAVGGNVKISIQEQNASRPELVSGLYEFTPDGTKFAKPVDLSFVIPVTTDYPGNLTVAWLDKTTNRWIPVPSTLDAKTGIMTGKITHFTAYAVIDRSKAEPEAEKLKKDIAATAKAITAAGEISDWQAIGLVRSGNSLPASYLSGVKAQLAENQGEFRKVTDYERLAMAISAAGGNPLNIDGYNLIEKIYNNENMIKQGTNGPIFALIALDSGNYSIPANAQWTKERLVQWILEQQSKDGGFPLTSGEADNVDITAMAVTALSVHAEQAAVKNAIDKAINWLSKQQLENGGFKLSGEENSESVAQVIIALSAAGAGPGDARFVKAKGGLLSNLATYRQTDGGYAHAAADKASNGLATEQALLALTAYDRFLNGQTKLYSFTEIPAASGSTAVVFADEKQISAWALQSVQKAFDQKLMQGVSSDSLVFAPKQHITRAQFAALLLRLTNNTPAPASSAPVFSDVKAGAWYYGDVLKAKELGIIDGVSKTAFHPNGTISRQDMAVMIYRAFKLEAPVDAQSFKDESKISSYASAAVHAVSDLGYMTGFDGAFDPSAPVTREMAAVVAVRLP